MSLVHLIVVKEKRLFFVCEHYRVIKKMLKGSFNFSDSLFLDAGYVVVDLNNKVIVDCQDAFDLKSDFVVFKP